jgi:hypothetical protein
LHGVEDWLRYALTMDVPATIAYARNLDTVVNSSCEIRGKRSDLLAKRGLGDWRAEFEFCVVCGVAKILAPI